MISNLVDFLEKACEHVKTLEQKADNALHNENNEEAYCALMQQKAEFLASLAMKALPVLKEAENTPQGQDARETLGSFSANAATALRLNSVFYMSALLYPDEHKAGEPNNLERLLQRVRT